MPIRYKPEVDILAMLKNAGYSTYRLRKEKILGESVLQKFRDRELPSWGEMEVICRLLECQPGDLVEYVPETAVPGQITVEEWQDNIT